MECYSFVLYNTWDRNKKLITDNGLVMWIMNKRDNELKKKTSKVCFSKMDLWIMYLKIAAFKPEKTL